MRIILTRIYLRGLHGLPDAWQERRDPVVRLLDRESLITITEWRGDRLRGLLENGALEMDALDESVLMPPEMKKRLQV